MQPPPAKKGRFAELLSPEFLRRIPKTDLHVHLDGSVRLETLIDLAKQHSVTLPAYTVDGLRETVFKKRYASLDEYLTCFKYTVAVMQDGEALSRVAYEFATDNYTEGVRYFEVRFAPQLHCDPNSDFDVIAVIKAVNSGLEKATVEWNAKPEVRTGQEPHYAYGIIVCALRNFDSGYSRYYKALCRLHQHEARDKVCGIASYALANDAVAAREQGLPVVALDLAGQETGQRNAAHKEAFSLAHRKFMNKTVHAGEACGANSIFEALTDCHADRIGHGFHLFDESRVDIDPTSFTQDPKEYVKHVVQYIADRRITVECCLTSNQQTLPHLEGDLARHPFRKMVEERLSVSICTDNRTVSNCTVTSELQAAIASSGLTAKALKEIIFNGFKRSFYPASYQQKRKYVRTVMNFYEQLEHCFLPAHMHCSGNSPTASASHGLFLQS